MTVLFFQDSCQQVSNSNLGLIRRLHMQYCTLQHPLESQSLARDFIILDLCGQRDQMFIKKIFELTLELFHVTTTDVDNLLSTAFKQQCIENMFGRQVFMAPFLRLSDRQSKCYLYIVVKHKSSFLLLLNAAP